MADPNDMFHQYVAAQDKAKETLALKDGLAAGRAWSRFVRSFEGPGPAGAWPASFASTDPDDFLVGALHFSILHLEATRDALLAGDRPVFITEMRKFGATITALLDTLPEADRFEART